MAWEIVDVAGYVSCKFPSNFLENVWEQNRELFIINSNSYSWTKGDNFWYMPDSPSGPTYFYERNNVKLGYQKYDSSSSLKYCNGTIYANGYYGGTSFNQVSGQNECTYAGFAFVKNDETQHAQVVVCWEFYFEQYNFYELHGYCAFGDWQIFPWLYNWITNNLPIHYTWQSVKSLKGINDFSISLPILSNINNGDPVSGASSSAFTKAPSAENNIKNLVDITLEPVATDSSATIFYTIPSGDYTSIKLYGRIGETPKCDNTDDVVQTLDQNETQISVTNLECGEYYFCIETINSGNVKQYSSVETLDLSFDWDGSETTILWSGDNNRMTAELIGQGGDPFITFRMYLGNDQIYQFVSQYVDTSQVPISRIVKDINIGFLIDNTKQMGRPSNIYYVSDQYATNYQKYIYNSEDEMPTESEMQDIYVWLSNGQPGPQPDPSVIQYINIMNNRQAYGFMWKTCPQTFSYRMSGIDYYCTVIYKYSDVSYYVFNTNGEVGHDFSFNERGWGLVPYLCTTGHMDTIYITSDGNGNYSCTVGPLTIVPGINTQYSTKYYSWKMSSSNSGSSFAQYLYWDNDGGMSGKSFSTTKSSIVSMFEWLSQKVRNVKIYVDGVLWADPTYEQN